MSREKRIDRTAFKRQTTKEAANTLGYWNLQSDAEKLRSAYHLSLRAFGFDPTNEPQLDRTKFSMRNTSKDG